MTSILGTIYVTLYHLKRQHIDIMDDLVVSSSTIKSFRGYPTLHPYYMLRPSRYNNIKSNVPWTNSNNAQERLGTTGITLIVSKILDARPQAFFTAY